MELTKVIELIKNQGLKNLDLKFNAAVECIDIVKLIVKENNKKLGTNDVLELYGAFKQAIYGDQTNNPPSPFSYINPLKYAEERAKWNAWHQLKGMSSDDAKKRYIELAIAMSIKHENLTQDVDFCDQTLIDKSFNLGIEKETEPSFLDALIQAGETLEETCDEPSSDDEATEPETMDHVPTMLNSFNHRTNQETFPTGDIDPQAQRPSNKKLSLS